LEQLFKYSHVIQTLSVNKNVEQAFKRRFGLDLPLAPVHRHLIGDFDEEGSLRRNLRGNPGLSIRERL
jgi:hypothetical protein